MNFKEISFGKASAEAEGQDSPRLLLDGYLDAEGLTSKAINSSEFLFLGYKGSGKSALGEHLRLRSESEPMLFAKHLFLSEFPFRSFQKIVGGSAEHEARFPQAWSWLLLLQLLDSFASDEGNNVTNNVAFDQAVDSLKRIGVLPAKGLKEIAIMSSKRSFKVNLPLDFGGLEYDRGIATGEDMRFIHIVSYLKQIALTVRTPSRHVIILDGLDDVLSDRDIQLQSLAALVTEAQRLNHDLKLARVSAKFIVLCRTDIFERLPGPNKNKIRQDSSIEFDWYHDPRMPNSSQLVALANLRAKLTYPDLVDVFKEFFPARLHNLEAVTFLLNHTRHTPRDFLQLLNHLKRYYTGKRFKESEIMSGIRDYSISYFLPEIKDELVGYLTPLEGEAILQIVASMGKREFTYDELEKARATSGRHREFNLESACEVLYNCSAIGHIVNSKMNSIFTFKYRNRHSAFHTGKRIILHRGIWKALSIPENREFSH